MSHVLPLEINAVRCDDRYRSGTGTGAGAGAGAGAGTDTDVASVQHSFMAWIEYIVDSSFDSWIGHRD
jgi:hypothetical protein